jgi:NAD(P)H-dependent FMN reductase
MRILVLSTSLNPASRSRVLARAVAKSVEAAGGEVTLIDLKDHPLPHCDGADAYADPMLPGIASAISRADAILAAAPVYNYDVGSPLKNLLELTGKKWEGKIVGFLLAAGGQGSFMGVMGFANSLMLDYRCLIIPRFVYATGAAFDVDGIADAEIATRVDGLAREALRLAKALA